MKFSEIANRLTGISTPLVGVSWQTTAGAWWMVLADVAIVHADGTVILIYVGQGSQSFTGPAKSSGMTSLSIGNRHLSGDSVAETPAVSTVFYHGDHLGSSRMLTNYFGYPVWSGTFLPFGQEWNPQITVNHYKFTGKERDAETGLDYFGARYYGSNMGRFLSPDEFAGGPVDVFGGDPTPPGPLPYADITNPQSLNKYSYTYNNPLRYTDPDGHDIWDTLLGVVNSTASNFAGVQRIDGGNADCRAGQVIGDVASVVAGTVGTIGAAAGDAALDVGTGGVALLAAPAQAAAVAIPANGALQGAKNLINTFSQSSNTNPFNGPVDKPVTTVDPKGNAIRVEKGEQLSGSKDGKYIQVKDAS